MDKEKVSKRKANAKKKKYRKLKFNPETVVSKKKFSLLPYTSVKFRRKYIVDQMVEIKSLPDYERIDRILNTDPDGYEKNPCPLPENKNKLASFYNTYSYLVDRIKKCILKNDWPCLTQCLLTLKDGPKYYQSFIFKAALINFMVNPASIDNSLYEDFLQQCLSCHTEIDMEQFIRQHFVIPKKQES